MLRIPKSAKSAELYRTEFSVRKFLPCGNLRRIADLCHAASFKVTETLYVVSGFKVNVFYIFVTNHILI